MAGAAGFEPAHGGIKSRCLTAWRRPSSRRQRVDKRPYSERMCEGNAGFSEKFSLSDRPSRKCQAPYRAESRSAAISAFA
jgi:hypothetical protein